MLAMLPLGDFGLWAQELNGEYSAHACNSFLFHQAPLVSPKFPLSHAAMLQARMHPVRLSIDRGGQNHHFSFAAASKFGKHRSCFVVLLKFIDIQKISISWVEKHIARLYQLLQVTPNHNFTRPHVLHMAAHKIRLIGIPRTHAHDSHGPAKAHRSHDSLAFFKARKMFLGPFGEMIIIYQHACPTIIGYAWAFPVQPRSINRANREMN